MSKATLKSTGYAVVKNISQSEHPKKIKISQKLGKSKINETLPFRIKFLPGIITGSSPTNPAPIGIAIIGVNNYIL